MDTKLVDAVTQKMKKIKHPDVRVGDVVDVHTKIKEGDKERIQVFSGMVIATKGSGVSKTLTVRKISYGIGVEKIFPLYAPTVIKIKVSKRSKVRRSKLYYLRDRVGKQALKAGVQIPVEGEDFETQQEEAEGMKQKDQNVEVEKEKSDTPKEGVEKKEKDKAKETKEKPKKED